MCVYVAFLDDLCLAFLYGKRWDVVYPQQQNGGGIYKNGGLFSHKKRNNKLGSQKNKIKYDYICTLSHLCFLVQPKKEEGRE